MHGTPLNPASPEQHARNVAALACYGILDTEAEPAFDAVVRSAARLFDAPTALVSLLDAERQWFKARVGLDASETPLDQSFCRHAVGGDAPLVVLDASTHPTFHDNPLVTGPPHIRFYVGAPIRMGGGISIGTLCVIDSASRPGVPEDLCIALENLATIVAELISNRAELRMLRRVGDLMCEAS